MRFYAWYSETHAKQRGTSVYETPEGKLVHVTGVYVEKDIGEKDYRYTDKVYVGEVTRYAGRGRHGKPKL
jgi:hypothetical protein